MATVKVTKLRALRALSGVTVKEITKMTGLSKSTISSYETMKKNMSRGSNYLLCDALGVEKGTNLTELVEVDEKLLSKGSSTFD